MSSTKLTPLVVEVIPNELQVLVYIHDIHHIKSEMMLSYDYDSNLHFGHPKNQIDPFHNVNIFL
jgi:hypothetical protein